ncbi:MAG: alpha/beta hydrolase [Legionellales bacterium]
MPYITINNQELFYKKQGLGDEMAFFSPGLLMTNDLFSKQIAFFENKYQCISYDHRGQGLSKNVTTTNLSLEDLYEDTVSLIEQLADKPVHFVGQSMGGFIGMRLAQRRPELIKTLTLVASSSKVDDWLFNLKIQLLMLGLRMGLNTVVAESICHTIFAKGCEHEFWKQQFLSLDSSANNNIAAINKRAGFTQYLQQIQVPTLILAGEKDKIFPPQNMEDLLAIPNAQFTIIPKAGHSLGWESPTLINQALLNFWTR